MVSAALGLKWEMEPSIEQKGIECQNLSSDKDAARKGKLGIP